MWLLLSSLNWRFLSLSPEISTSHFSSNNIQTGFIHTKKIDLYNEAFQRMLVGAKRLKHNLDNSEVIQNVLQQMRQEVYRQFIIKILSDLRDDFVNPNKKLCDGT